jgi:hypothetical protein
MSKNHQFTSDLEQSNIYQIRVKECLREQWQDWFEEMTITQASNGETVLTGHIIDQAQLYGLLKKVRNLGLTLISVNHMNSEDDL